MSVTAGFETLSEIGAREDRPRRDSLGVDDPALTERFTGAG
jgi:hypothetical protein